MPNVENHEWSYINVPGKTNLVHKTVGQLVTESAKIYGEKEAVVFLDQNIRKNFLQINEEANKMAAALLSIGLQPGDRVIIASYAFIHADEMKSHRPRLVFVDEANQIKHCGPEVPGPQLRNVNDSSEAHFAGGASPGHLPADISQTDRLP